MRSIDCTGYVPRVVEAGARLLASRVSRYLFVSSMSVYAKTDRPDMDESTPVATLDDPDTEQVLAHYGALKAACEAVVERSFGDARDTRAPRAHRRSVRRHRPLRLLGRALRASAAARRPAGARGRSGTAASAPIQFVDARDLAAWMLDLAERDVAGTFNACSPAGHWTMGDARRGVARRPRPSPPTPAWIDDDALLAHGIAPWIGLPLWLPANDPDSAGFMTMNCAARKAAGLATRPLARHDRRHRRMACRARQRRRVEDTSLTADAERALLELDLDRTAVTRADCASIGRSSAQSEADMASAANGNLWDNPLGTDGFEFVEYAAPDPQAIGRLFEQMGFTAIARHRSKNVLLYRQGDDQLHRQRRAAFVRAVVRARARAEHLRDRVSGEGRRAGV